MSSDISLTAAQRGALIDLRSNSRLSSRTQLRLSSGRKINNVVDDSVNYFKSKQLSDTAKDFSNLKAEIGQAVSQLEVTLETISGLETILGQMKGILEAARSQSTNERILANKALKTLGQQFVELVEDSSYGGNNLINSTNAGRTVQFGTRSNSKLELPGLDFLDAADADNRVFSDSKMFVLSNGNMKFQFNEFFTHGTSKAAAGLSSLGVNNSQVKNLDNSLTRIKGAIEKLRGHAQALGSNVAILQVREQFTDRYVSLSKVGAEKFTLADLNEEGANLVALQTRQQLGIQSLAVAGQQQRNILTLLQ